ncbi:MAG: murein biosynthesis integral membrane protein MurJ [Chlamydia sp.]
MSENHPSQKTTQEIIKPDSTRSIMRSAIGFLSGTVFSRISGLIRDMLLAFSFGTSEALSALFVAFRLSHICRRLFGEGILQSAFIPLFEKIRNESQEKAFFFFRDMNVLWSSFLLLFTIIASLILCGVSSFCELSEGSREILFLMIIVMPSIMPICLFGLNASLLQCEKRYFTVGIAPTCFNLALAAAALIFRSYEPKLAMPYIAISICIGCFFQWLVTFMPAFRLTQKALGKTQIAHNISLFSVDIQRIWKPLLLGLLGVGATQINNAIDSIFARIAAPEGPAQLWFGLRLQQLPLALFGVALSGALLPPLSRAIQAQNREQYGRFLEFAIRRVFAFLLPCTAFLLLLGMASINMIYGRGDFQIESIIKTTGCLHGYALALIPMGLIIILAPAFYAKQQYMTPTKGACISLFINTTLSALFVTYFQWGAISISIATSTAAWMNALYLYTRIEKNFGIMISQEGKIACFRTAVAVAIATLSTWIFTAYSSGIPLFFTLFQNSTRLLPQTVFSQITSFLFPTTFFLFALMIAGKFCNATDLTHVLRTKEELPEANGD